MGLPDRPLPPFHPDRTFSSSDPPPARNLFRREVDIVVLDLYIKTPTIHLPPPTEPPPPSCCPSARRAKAGWHMRRGGGRWMVGVLMYRSSTTMSTSRRKRLRAGGGSDEEKVRSGWKGGRGRPRPAARRLVRPAKWPG